MKPNTPVNILLAEDDDDDFFLFKEVLAEITKAVTNLERVKDGQELMDKLHGMAFLPDFVFLDINYAEKGWLCKPERDPRL